MGVRRVGERVVRRAFKGPTPSMNHSEVSERDDYVSATGRKCFCPAAVLLRRCHAPQPRPRVRPRIAHAPRRHRPELHPAARRAATLGHRTPTRGGGRRRQPSLRRAAGAAARPTTQGGALGGDCCSQPGLTRGRRCGRRTCRTAWWATWTAFARKFWPSTGSGGWRSSTRRVIRRAASPRLPRPPQFTPALGTGLHGPAEELRVAGPRGGRGGASRERDARGGGAGRPGRPVRPPAGGAQRAARLSAAAAPHPPGRTQRSLRACPRAPHAAPARAPRGPRLRPGATGCVGWLLQAPPRARGRRFRLTPPLPSWARCGDHLRAALGAGGHAPGAGQSGEHEQPSGGGGGGCGDGRAAGVDNTAELGRLAAGLVTAPACCCLESWWMTANSAWQDKGVMGHCFLSSARVLCRLPQTAAWTRAARYLDDHTLPPFMGCRYDLRVLWRRAGLWT